MSGIYKAETRHQ